MSVWRRKGLELFYDFRHTFTGKDDTIYILMVQLRSRVEDAHLKKDTDELDKIYGYVEWSVRRSAGVRKKEGGPLFARNGCGTAESKGKVPLIPPA